MSEKDKYVWIGKWVSWMNPKGTKRTGKVIDRWKGLNGVSYIIDCGKVIKSGTRLQCVLSRHELSQVIDANERGFVPMFEGGEIVLEERMA